MALLRGRPTFDEPTLEADVDRALRFHRSEGFYAARVEANVERNEARGLVDIELEIERGPPTQLRKLDVRWREPENAPIELALVLAAHELQVGERFGARRYESSRKALLAALADAGHPLASLEGGASVILEESLADVHWVVTPGPAVQLGPITVVGLETVDEVMVRRPLAIQTGQPFSPSALRAAERAIYGNGLFRSVAARPLRGAKSEPGSDERDEPAEVDASNRGTQPVIWPIEIRVDERERRSIRVGGGWGTEDEFRVRGEWHHRNLFGQGENLEISGKYSSIVAGGEARYRDPSFIDPDIELEAPLGFERETEPGFDVNRTFVGFELSRAVFEHWRFTGGYRFELANPTDIDSDPFADNESTVRLSSLLVRVRRLDLDDLFDPKFGSRIEIQMRPTLSALGSDIDTVELTSKLRWYYTWRSITLALRADSGTIEPVGSTSSSEVPIFVRFFAGGSTSVRGYDRHALGPLDDDGDPLGGLSWSEGSAELRFPIWNAISGVFFFDVGQIRTKPHDWALNDYSAAWGGGIRIATPVGPLRFDLGIPLDDRPNAEAFEIYLSVGHTF